MEIYNEEQDDRDRVFELGEASSTIDGVQTPAKSDEALCNAFLNLPYPKLALSREGVKSTCMEQIMLIKNRSS